VFAPGESISISTNGWISLAGATVRGYQNSTLPATTVTQTAGGTGVVPASLIAPFWDDLVLPSALGSVSSRVTGIAPNRQFIVEWSKASIIDDSGTDKGANITFEVILFEGSNDVQFVYGDMTGPFSDGSSATVGMQDLSRTTAVLTSFNQPVVKSHSSITYSYRNGNYVATNGITDTAPPGKPVVTDEGKLTANQTQLAASWTADAPASGISSFQYAIGTTPGGTNIVPFTSTAQNSVIVAGLNLQANTTYYFAVKAVSGAGFVSDIGVSDGIQYAPTFQPQIKIIPWGPQSSNQFTGIALLAPQGTAETVVMRAFDANGKYLLGAGIRNPVTISLAAGQQSAKLVSELFGLQTFDGWIQVEASSAGLGVFTATGASDLSAMDGNVPRDPLTDFVLFHAGASAILVNPSPRTANVTITDLGTNAVQTFTIAPTTRLVMTLSGPSRVKSSEALAAIEQTTSTGRIAVNTAEAVSAAQSTLVFPDAVSGGGYSSTLTLVNVTGTARNLTIAFAGSTTTMRIDANGLLKIPISSPGAAADAVRVITAGTLFGGDAPALVGVLDIDNGADPVTIGARPATTDFWFPQVANGAGLFTGLALASGTAAANVTVEVYDPSGSTPKSATIALDAGKQAARLVSDIVAGTATQVGGYIHVHSDQPINAWEIYGSDRIQASGPPL
ncbi:MAG TPA: hypothetical protein VKY31_16725, partial [Terriglobia bacterium]|nr:hypothetical protein [Terriglobia bacterium]